MAFWMVRAGDNGYLVDDFERRDCVAVAWRKLRDLSQIEDEVALMDRVRKSYPLENARQLAPRLRMTCAFVLDMQLGDTVLSYDPLSRQYLFGRLTGEYVYRPGYLRDPDYAHVRPVEWRARINRDTLALGAQRSLGRPPTIFDLPAQVCAEIEAQLRE